MKFLLLDLKEIKRNSERSKPGTPVALVTEVDADGNITTHTGFAILAVGPVSLAYSQRGFVTNIGREKFPAAYSTEGEVRIATERDEDLTVDPKPATKKAPK